MNKLLILTCAGLLAFHAGHAQEFRTKLNGKEPKVILEIQSSDITVEGIDGDELVIRGNGYEEAPERAKGLRPVYNAAVDNTKIGLAVTQQDNTVRIVRASRKDANYVIRLPRRAALEFKQAGWSGGDLAVRDLSGDIEVSMNSGDIQLTNVAGPVVANTVSGDIQVRFAPMRQGPTSISSVSGDVDVSMPSNTKATLKLRSISGEVYTDFEMNLGNRQDDMQQIGGQMVDSSINGGGNAVSLKTVSGDIYVRKAK